MYSWTLFTVNYWRIKWLNQKYKLLQPFCTRVLDEPNVDRELYLYWQCWAKCFLIIIFFILDKTIRDDDGKLTSGREVPKLLGNQITITGKSWWILGLGRGRGEIPSKGARDSLSSALAFLVFPRMYELLCWGSCLWGRQGGKGYGKEVHHGKFFIFFIETRGLATSNLWTCSFTGPFL